MVEQGPLAKYIMTPEEVSRRMYALRIDRSDILVYGVPRGGVMAAQYLKHAKVTYDIRKANVVLDDIIDLGTTMRDVVKMDVYPTGAPFVALVDKLAGTTDVELGWVVFPWENENDPTTVSGLDISERILTQQSEFRITF